MNTKTEPGNLPATVTRSKDGGPGGAPRGNQNALKEGIYATSGNALKLRHRRVRRLVDKAFSVCSWLQASDLPTIRSWAETVVLKSVCFAVLQQGDIYRVDLTGDIVGKRLLQDWARLSSLELAYARELGMTPASRASMGVNIAQGRFLTERLAEHGDA